MAKESVEQAMRDVIEWLRDGGGCVSEEELADYIAADEETLRAALALGLERGKLSEEDGLYSLTPREDLQ